MDNQKTELKLVFTFGVGTKYSGKVVIINCNNIMTALQYVFNKYGNTNVCTNYHYNETSLKNGCEWQDGLFQELKDSYDYGEALIEKYNYEVIEEVVLEDEKNV